MLRHLLLDTHVWIWLITEVDALKSKLRAEIMAAQEHGMLYVSAFSIWEVAQKESKGKLSLEGGVDALLRSSFDDGALRIAECTSTIFVAANRLPGQLHGDPADRIIVATAREGGYVLFTHDDHILRYAKQGYVEAQKA